MHKQVLETFSQWTKRFGRVYSSEEDRLQREKNYRAYQKQVQRNAKAQPGVKYGMDIFADWSPAELHGLRGLKFEGNMTYRDPTHVFEGTCTCLCCMSASIVSGNDYYF